MEIATRIFDGIFPKEGASLPLKDRNGFDAPFVWPRCCTTLGTRPEATCRERVSAKKARRSVAAAENNEADEAKTATHEDYTAAILLNTDMRDLIRSRFESGGVIPKT
jgi:hypothetical protein